MPDTHIAFLGLGIMGSGMAARLVQADFPVTVFNRNADKAKPLAAKGAKVARSPREAAANAGVIISMLADDEASRSLWLGDNGALAGARPNSLLIESSTVTPAWIHELAAAAKQKSCDLLDAPVTGSKPQAANGELLFLVGGSEESFTRAKPILTPMARDIQHLGPTGAGALFKLINHDLCGVQLVSLAEALTLIERSGLDRDKALAMLSTGTPGSPMIKNLATRMAANAFEPNFALHLMDKDMRYAIAEAAKQHVTFATGTTAHHTLEQAIAAGLGNKDLSAAIELLRQQKDK
ncbi:MAG: NAD(P)-dependent oxidoreductase [Phycisphaerae bacterium]